MTCCPKRNKKFKTTEGLPCREKKLIERLIKSTRKGRCEGGAEFDELCVVLPDGRKFCLDSDGAYFK